MKTSKITNIQFKKEYDSKFGKLYSHFIELENGDSGEISAKSELPEKLSVGKELSYEISQPNPKYSPKIKAVSPKYSPQSNGNSELESRVKTLESDVETLKQTIKSLVQANKLIYLNNPANYQKPPRSKAEEILDRPKPDSDLPF